MTQTVTAPDETRINEQRALAGRLGIETSSATYIARTLELLPDAEAAAQATVLASAYELEPGDVTEISKVFGRRRHAAAA
ncbi:hypothetical protein [Arthrobacter sp. IK3]|uniref:hypothetical protein n=1 Tax=Arthrobacter sp. IK3 TaxID=3448169 RepID=UPI003EE1EA1B